MGFKRIKPGIIKRIAAGWPTGLAATLAGYTIIGVPFQFLPSNVWFAIPASIAPIVIGLIAAFIKGKFVSIPPMLVDELCQEGKYRCEPCTGENLKLACEIVRPIFGTDHVDSLVLEQWRLQNPHGVMQITNEQDELVACFIFEGLQSSFFDQLIKGTVVEAQISGATVLPMRAAKKQPRIYISGVMVKDPHTYLGAKRARIMLWCMIKYINHHFGVDKTLYALGLNKDSERLLNSLGFSVAVGAENRKDRHNFYQMRFARAAGQRILQRLGDLSSCCKISYSVKAQQ
jgi:hypothetical protein